MNIKKIASHLIKDGYGHLIIAKSILEFQRGSLEDIKMIEDWLSTLRLTGRAPSGMKKHFESLVWIKEKLNQAKELGFDPTTLIADNIRATFSYWTQADIDLINSKLSKEGKETDTLEINGNTYINRSVMSFKAFKEKTDVVESVLKSLKGFHKKAIKNLKVVFVKKEESKTAAKYKTDKDAIFIRPDKTKKESGYGSFPYILVHELGHRYEHYYTQTVDFEQTEWITTIYSRKEGWAGSSEKFAELFALSNWKEEYPQYKDKIEKFEKIII